MIQVPSSVVANEQTCRVTIFSEAQQNEVKFAHALQRFGVGARAFDAPSSAALTCLVSGTACQRARCSNRLLGHHQSDLLDRTGRNETLGTNLRAVHDCAAPKQSVRIVQVI